MPYISYNGQLYEITQAQYNSYTIGSPLPSGAVLSNAGNVAAGGTVTNTNSVTETILTPNTTNTSPGQTLTTTSTTVNTTATTTVSADTQKLIDSGLYDPGVGFNANGTPVNTSATTVDSTVNPQTSLATGETIVPLTQVNTSAPPVNSTVDPTASATSTAPATTNTGTGTSADSSAQALNDIKGQVQDAQNQQTLADQRKQVNNGDWRVRLRLAPQANYLYRAAQPGILQPLAVTDGIIFPYTPSISTSYRAQYSPYDLTHSNYRGYFYQNSFVDAINLTATFTAQDTNDANYVLAVIHFFRSVTKMFYGQDAQRGSPPPVCFLSGFGDYQFKEHPCLVSQFNYSLPAEVDYIRAGSPNNVGLNLTSIRDRQSVATNSIFGSINRLAAAFLNKGALSNPAAPPTLGLNRPTYVPTKLDITLTLLPIQSRQQISKQFSVKEFANGNLLKGGFW